MATDVGAGAAVEARRAAVHIIEAGRDAHLGRAVIVGSTTVAGRAARGHRTVAQQIMLGVGIIPVRSSGARWRLAVTGGAVGMCGLHIAGMAGRTRAGRETRFQIRNAGGVAKATVTTMGDIHRRVRSRTRVVTIVTWAGQGHIQVRHMVGAAVRRRIGRMAIQTVGRINACIYGVNHRLPRAVMAGFTGAGPVGGDVVLGAVNLTPGRHDVTAATGCPAGQVFGSQCNSMAVTVMDRIPGVCVAAGAVAGGRLVNRQADQFSSRGVMAAETCIVGLGRCTDQGVIVTACTAGAGDGDDT